MFVFTVSTAGLCNFNHALKFLTALIFLIVTNSVTRSLMR